MGYKHPSSFRRWWWNPNPKLLTEPVMEFRYGRTQFSSGAILAPVSFFPLDARVNFIAVNVEPVRGFDADLDLPTVDTHYEHFYIVTDTDGFAGASGQYKHA